MRISDWSSDVCSSDLSAAPPQPSTRATTTIRRLEADELIATGVLGAGRIPLAAAPAVPGRLASELQPAPARAGHAAVLGLRGSGSARGCARPRQIARAHV